MLKCTFIVIYVFSFVLSEKCLTGFTGLVIMLDNNHRSSTCRASLSRATVAVSETILVTLLTYRAVQALRTSLLVVSAHLHSRGGGVSEAGIGNPNLRKLPLFAHSYKLTIFSQPRFAPNSNFTKPYPPLRLQRHSSPNIKPTCPHERPSPEPSTPSPTTKSRPEYLQLQHIS